MSYAYTEDDCSFLPRFVDEAAEGLSVWLGDDGATLFTWRDASPEVHAALGAYGYAFAEDPGGRGGPGGLYLLRPFGFALGAYAPNRVVSGHATLVTEVDYRFRSLMERFPHPAVRSQKRSCASVRL